MLALIALGLTAVLISGGFDMSAGAGSQMAANFAAGAILQGFGTAAALAVGCVAGLIVGAVNAMLVILFRMQPFVATLGSMFVLMGITLFYNGGHALTIYDQPIFFFLGQGHLGPVPFVIVILALTVAVLHLFFKRTRAGLHMYAIGENLPAARLRGISQRQGDARLVRHWRRGHRLFRSGPGLVQLRGLRAGHRHGFPHQRACRRLSGQHAFAHRRTGYDWHDDRRGLPRFAVERADPDGRFEPRSSRESRAPCWCFRSCWA